MKSKCALSYNSKQNLSLPENQRQSNGRFEVAKLQMEAGKLLIEKSCFVQGKELLTQAANNMRKVSYTKYPSVEQRKMGAVYCFTNLVLKITKKRVNQVENGKSNGQGNSMILYGL